jgi:hypothetical protein
MPQTASVCERAFAGRKRPVYADCLLLVWSIDASICRVQLEAIRRENVCFECEARCQIGDDPRCEKGFPVLSVAKGATVRSIRGSSSLIAVQGVGTRRRASSAIRVDLGSGELLLIRACPWVAGQSQSSERLAGIPTATNEQQTVQSLSQKRRRMRWHRSLWSIVHPFRWCSVLKGN